MNAPSASAFRAALIRSRLLWVGVVLLVLGTGPLVVICILDPASNPIGPGLLAFFTFWPAIALIVAGIARSITRARA